MTHAPLPLTITVLMTDRRQSAMLLTRDSAQRDDLVPGTVLHALKKRDLLTDPEGLRRPRRPALRLAALARFRRPYRR